MTLMKLMPSPRPIRPPIAAVKQFYIKIYFKINCNKLEKEQGIIIVTCKKKKVTYEVFNSKANVSSVPHTRFLFIIHVKHRHIRPKLIKVIILIILKAIYVI